MRSPILAAVALSVLLPGQVMFASHASATPTCYDVELHLGSPPYPTVTVCTPF